MPSDDMVLPNNSLISLSRLDIIPSFRCLSGSSAPSVGKLIGPLGNDITLNPSDPFFVSRGGSYDPGTMLVRGLQPLQWEDTGIYTYRTPDENGNIVDFHFGIYLSDYSGSYITCSKVNWTQASSLIFLGPPFCSDIEYGVDGGVHTLSCDSYITPPTEIIWEKDGGQIYFNDTTFADYSSTQTLVNRTISAYSNVLSISASIEDVIGEYSCTVINSLGSSETVSISIEGKQGEIGCGENQLSTFYLV